MNVTEKDVERVLEVISAETYKYRSTTGIMNETGLSLDSVITCLRRLAHLLVTQYDDRPDWWGLRTKHPDSHFDPSKKPAEWWVKATTSGAATITTETKSVVVNKTDPPKSSYQKETEITDKVRAFAADLAKVMAKHNAWLGGCNCCSSPYGEVSGHTYEHMRVQAESYIFRLGGKEYTASVVYERIPASKCDIPPADVQPLATSQFKSHVSLKV